MKQAVKFFTSFAEKDAKGLNRIFDMLKLHLVASKGYDYRVWDCHQLLVGEHWDKRIQEEIRLCSFGLLCISPAFLGSQYITQNELPPFIHGTGKPIIPIGLKPVDFKRHDLKGLDEYQIFRLGSRYFSELTSTKREAFAFALFQQIEDRLDRFFSAATAS